MFLDRAVNARERAQRTADEGDRLFHGKMEASWMRMAASAAFVERVDLLLHTLDRAVPPSDKCPGCARLMRLRTIEADKSEQVFTFECTSCGSTEHRRVSF
jgi:hypothetical protein